MTRSDNRMGQVFGVSDLPEKYPECQIFPIPYPVLPQNEITFQIVNVSNMMNILASSKCLGDIKYGLGSVCIIIINNITTSLFTRSCRVHTKN